jgi:6-phosphogluconolactonase
MTPVDVVVTETAEDAARTAARHLAEAAGRGGHVALAGGSTPRRAYELAASLEPDWSRVSAWFGDERCVPADDERSNHRLVRESLVEHVQRPPFLRAVPTELPPKDAAASYAQALEGIVLDLAFLGLGADGHTASLFPGAPSLDEDDARAVAVPAGLPPWVERVTMTIPMLSDAREIVFLAVGTDKADAARRAFGEPPSRATPASLVRSTRGRTIVILDREAAAELRA